MSVPSTAMLVALVLCAGAAPAQAICRSQEAACVDRLIADMQQHIDRLGCRHDAPFALLYERTTEGIRAALQSGAFSEPPLWNQVTTAFGRYYLDAAAAWRRGHRSRVPRAWRIAFTAAREERVATLGDVLLGINAATSTGTWPMSTPASACAVTPTTSSSTRCWPAFSLRCFQS